MTLFTQRPLRSGEIMKRVRVMLVLLVLSALPLVAVAAQGQGDRDKCKEGFFDARAAGRSSASKGRVGAADASNLPPGQAKKCSDPVPAPVPPPSGPPIGP